MLDPNQVRCSCGRLVRVLPASSIFADCVFTDCDLGRGLERCRRCSGLADVVKDGLDPLPPFIPHAVQGAKRVPP
jgi:hypothetical protein